MQEHSTELMKSAPECVILEKIKLALSLDIDVDELLDEVQKNAE
mgnify:FL=1